MSYSNIGTIRRLCHYMPVRGARTWLQPCTMTKTRRSPIIPSNWSSRLLLTTLSTRTCTLLVRTTGQIQYSSLASSDSNGSRRRRPRESSPNEFELNTYYTHIYRSDMLMSDPHHTRLRLRGRHIYLGVIQSLRWSIRWYYGRDGAQVHVVSMHPPTRSPLRHDHHDANDDNDEQHKPTTTGTNTSEDAATTSAASELRVRWRFESKKSDQSSSNGVASRISSATTRTLASLLMPSSLSDSTSLPKEKGKSDTDALSSSSSSTSSNEMTTVVCEGVFAYRFDVHGRISEFRIEHLAPTPGPQLLANWRIQLLRWWPQLSRELKMPNQH
ncbi:hypothetical protein BDF22DRAFT_739271 [Syncephalis plumigaleata]|nr:hypothetical protein BDF22DRAFT_739271 [Syncephalis plumigaleata]